MKLGAFQVLSVGDNNQGQHVLWSCSPCFTRDIFLMWCWNYNMGHGYASNLEIRGPGHTDTERERESE